MLLFIKNIMSSKKIRYLLLTFISIAPLILHKMTIQKETQTDLDFIHQNILDHHPGPHNNDDPDFLIKMHKAYQQAQKNITYVYTESDHLNLLQTYAKTIQPAYLEVYGFNFYYDLIETTSDFYIEQKSPDLIWINLPTWIITDRTEAKINHIIAELPKHQTTKCIVLDVRNNLGGDSRWGTALLESLFTSPYVDQVRDTLYADVFKELRVTRENIASVVDIATRSKMQFGQNSEQFEQAQKLVQGMEQALENKQLFYRANTTASEPITGASPSENTVTAKIIVLMNYKTGGSCLMFINELKQLYHNVLLIGQKTDGDAPYWDSRPLVLPSQRFMLSLPTAVIRNYTSKGFFMPDIPFPDDLTSDQEQKWIEDTITKLW